MTIHDGQSTRRFAKCHRLITQQDFRRVFAMKLSAADGRLVVYGAFGHARWSRLGISVGRRYGNAVLRNRFKRIVREAFRLSRDQLPPAMDIIVIPRAGVMPDLAHCQGSLIALCAKLHKRHQRRTSCAQH